MPESRPPDTGPIHRLIRATRRSLRSSWVVTGLGLTFGLGLGLLVAVALADLAAPLAPWLRVAGLMATVVPTLWALLAGVVRPLFRRLGPARVARRIESRLPGIHNRLLNIVDLDRSRQAQERSPTFFARLVQEAIERLRHFRPWSVVDHQALRRATLFGATSLAAFLVALGVFSDRLPTAIARIVSPLADIPPASHVRFGVIPGSAKVLRGDDLTIAVDVTRGEPEGFRLELRPEGGAKPIWYDLAPRGPNRWEFTLSGFDRSFAYRVHGGGTWSKKHAITMVDRPSILGLRTALHAPDYMGETEPRRGPPQVADVTGMEGSRVEVTVQARGDVSEGEIELLTARPKSVAVVDRPERIWHLLEHLPEGSSAEGAWQWDYKLRGRPVHSDPPTDGPHGHGFHNAPVGFRVRKDDVLFAHLYLDPSKRPQEIMLQWSDGASLEHRAYWGEDRLPHGQPDTPSRRRIGPLPEAGGWVRLEVPAAAVGLEGKELRGLTFHQFGGQAHWHRAGTLPPASVVTTEFVVASRHPMHSAGGAWSGSFPLERAGAYRVVLRNELGHANKPMKEARLVALPDNPPRVVLDKPAIDLTLAAPAKVPLVVTATDDFGLAEVVVSVQKGDSGGFVGRPVAKFAKPSRQETAVSALDLNALGVKVGEHVRYRVEARDRKGQSAQTREYVIRVGPDPNAADTQLDALKQRQKPTRDKLDALIAEQAKVQDALEKLAEAAAPLEKKLEAAKAKLAETPLDPESAKQLAEVRQQLGQLADQEAQNARAAEAIASELKQSAEVAANQALVPPEVAAEMTDMAREFVEDAQAPLQAEAAALRAGADPNRAAPKPSQLEAAGEQIAENLDAMKARLDALARAQDRLAQDPDAALAELRGERGRREADEARRDLNELQEFMSKLQDQLKQLEGDEGQLLAAAKEAPEILLPDVENKQDSLEPEADRRIEEVRALQATEEVERLRRPDAARPPEGDDPEMIEPDPDAPNPSPEEVGDDNPAADPPFQPALGKPKAKAGEAKGKGSKQAAAKSKASGEQGRRERLEGRAEQTLEELGEARESLASDQEALGELTEQLKQAKGDGELLRSDRLQQARAMAERMRQLAQGKPSDAPPQPGATPSTRPNAGVQKALDAELARLDPDSRAVVLKMPAKVREELLQGLREQGPEGYAGLIQDYFKRLTETKNPK